MLDRGRGAGRLVYLGTQQRDHHLHSGLCTDVFLQSGCKRIFTMRQRVKFILALIGIKYQRCHATEQGALPLLIRQQRTGIRNIVRAHDHAYFVAL